jgi:hypothetical protein
MTAHNAESISTWLVDRSILAAMRHTMPPRDPNDDDGDEDEEGRAKPDDELEPAVIREPDK